MNTAAPRPGSRLAAVSHALRTIPHRHRVCAVCGLEITGARPSLRLHGIRYHSDCVHLRPGQRLIF